LKFQNHNIQKQIFCRKGLLCIDFESPPRQIPESLPLDIPEKNLLGIGLNAVFTAVNKGRRNVKTKQQIGQSRRQRQRKTRQQKRPEMDSAGSARIQLPIGGKPPVGNGGGKQGPDGNDKRQRNRTEIPD